MVVIVYYCLGTTATTTTVGVEHYNYLEVVFPIYEYINFVCVCAQCLQYYNMQLVYAIKCTFKFRTLECDIAHHVISIY